jgi:hypothetical protein
LIISIDAFGFENATVPPGFENTIDASGFEKVTAIDGFENTICPSILAPLIWKESKHCLLTCGEGLPTDRA